MGKGLNPISRIGTPDAYIISVQSRATSVFGIYTGFAGRWLLYLFHVGKIVPIVRRALEGVRLKP